MCWKSHYAGDRLCWLHSYSLYFGFLLPVGIMFFINFFGFFVIMHKIHKKRPNVSTSKIQEALVTIYWSWDYIWVYHEITPLRYIWVVTGEIITSQLGQRTKKDPELKDQLVRGFTISSLLGVTWVFAVPLTISDDLLINEIFGWLFSLGNGFQVCVLELHLG